jgi:hypothetical protein
MAFKDMLATHNHTRARARTLLAPDSLTPL